MILVVYNQNNKTTSCNHWYWIKFKMKQIVVGIFLLSLSWTSVAKDNKFTVSDIEIVGLQRVAIGAVLTHVPFSVNDEVSEYIVSQSLKNLYRSGHFADIKVYLDGDKVIYQVTERPTISEIEFDGNSDIKDEQLQSSLDENNIRVGESLDRTVLTNIETGLTEFYHSVGKYNAQIKTDVTYLPRNRVRLKFQFEEGDAAKIKQINLVGNKSFSDEEILANIESRHDLSCGSF
jgi:outer membrane protein insertion porin family